MKTLVFPALLVLTGCVGGTWVDDARNFDRIFGFAKPQNVTVIHSYYWKSPHWTTEYRYYIAMRAPRKFDDGLTDTRLMTSMQLEETLVGSCGDSKPQWFLPKPLINYEAWISRSDNRYRVFRDKTDGTLFVCDQRL